MPFSEAVVNTASTTRNRKGAIYKVETVQCANCGIQFPPDTHFLNLFPWVEVYFPKL